MELQTILPLVVGGFVLAGVALTFLALGRRDESRASSRLDVLVGRNTRKDSSADMLLKQALEDVDKKTFLDRITPSAFNLTKLFEQADVNIKPSALFGIALALSGVGAGVTIWLVNVYVAPVAA